MGPPPLGSMPFNAFFFFMPLDVCLHVCLCAACMSGAHGNQKKLLNLLELESEAVVTCHVGAGH